jgi:hypothetical protein
MQTLGGTWDDTAKEWRVPAAAYPEVRKLISDLGFDKDITARQAEPASTAAPVAPVTATTKVGARHSFASGKDHATGKTVENFKGTVARVAPDGRLMVNAGTKTRPRWVVTTTSQIQAPTKAPAAARAVNESKRDYAESLTADEIKAIDAYMGENYKSINGTLRRGDPPSAITAKRIANLDAAVAKGVLAKDTRLYRAGTLGGNPADMVGKTFVDHGFVSTSEKTTLPLRMAASQREGVFMRINAPAGANVGFLSKFRNQQSVSKYGGVNEDEALLPRDSEFIVRSARQGKDGMWTVEMDLVQTTT